MAQGPPRGVESAHVPARAAAGPAHRPPASRGAGRAARADAAGSRARPPGGWRATQATAQLIARSPKTAQKPITAPGTVGMQQYNERAYEHFQAGRYEQAIADWAEAYKLRPISTFLRDQGEALERLRRSEDAAKMYEQYLANGPLTADRLKYRSRIQQAPRRAASAPGEDDDEPEIKAVGKEGAQAWFDRGQDAVPASATARPPSPSARPTGCGPTPTSSSTRAQRARGGRAQARRRQRLRALPRRRRHGREGDREDQEAARRGEAAGSGRRDRPRGRGERDAGRRRQGEAGGVRVARARPGRVEARRVPALLRGVRGGLRRVPRPRTSSTTRPPRSTWPATPTPRSRPTSATSCSRPKAKDVERIRKRIALLRANPGLAGEKP